jgi:hypothetical protein
MNNKIGKVCLAEYTILLKVFITPHPTGMYQAIHAASYRWQHNLSDKDKMDRWIDGQDVPIRCSVFTLKHKEHLKKYAVDATDQADIQ